MRLSSADRIVVHVTVLIWGQFSSLTGFLESWRSETRVLVLAGFMLQAAAGKASSAAAGSLAAAGATAVYWLNASACIG